MIAKDVITVINEIAPPFLAEKWDNSGLQLGSIEKKVSKILLALDISQAVVTEALNNSIDMIITHHPLIFSGLKSISNDETKGEMIYNLIKNDIVVFAAHTNLDISENGPNDYLGKLLGLNDLDILNVTWEKNIDDMNSYNNKKFGNGRIGTLDESKTLGDYAEYVKKKLSCSSVRVYGDIDKKVSRIAICGGSGGDFIIDAYKKGAQLYITGDVKYHDAQLALELGLSIIDAGHFDTEKHILSLLSEYLRGVVSENASILIYEGNEYSFKVI